jgi:hypothetical protein
MESFIILRLRGWGGCYVFPLYVIFATAVNVPVKEIGVIHAF